MKKWFFLITLVISGALMATVAPVAPGAHFMPTGALCDMGPNAAASLLVPFFEVDSIDDTGIDTLVAVTNVSPFPTIAHVVLYNTDSIHSIDFNIYLTGFDVATFSMRSVIVNGVLPNNGCASATSAFLDGWIDCNKDGAYFNQVPPNTDPLYPFIAGNCGGSCDWACYPTLDPSLLSYVQFMHTQCSYDNPTLNYTGYLTIDNSYTCQGGFPDEFAYYYTPVLDWTQALNANPTLERDSVMLYNSNQLMGDYIYVDRGNNFAQGNPCVHIEAFGYGVDQNPTGTMAAQYYGMQTAQWQALGLQTYYGRYVTWGSDVLGVCVRGADGREPLPLGWGFRYLENAAFDGGTDALIWRASMYWNSNWTFADTQYAECHSTMYDYWGTYELKLPDPGVLFWDEEENQVVAGGGPSQPTQVIGVEVPVEAARYAAGELLSTPFESGWAWFDFATDARVNGFGLPWGIFAAYDQAWVDVVYSALGRFSVGLSGIVIENNCSHDYTGGVVTVTANDF